MLFSLLVTVIIVLLILWLINSFLPVDPRIRQAITVVVVVLLVIYLVGILTGHPVSGIL